MAKKHKHEEHVNHERWLVSFADMMTLLFALFVVLYAMGVQDLERLKELKKSIQFAFNITGSGKTHDTGIFNEVQGGGELHAPAPLVTAQDGDMRRFLEEQLQDFEETSGSSIEINVTNDSITLTAPVSKFFEPNRAYPIRPEVQRWLDETIAGSLSYTSDIRIVIEAPDLPIFQTPQGKTVTSIDLCIERLRTLDRMVRINPQVLPSMVAKTWRVQSETPGRVGDWEQQAVVVIGFSNMRPENR